MDSNAEVDVYKTTVMTFGSTSSPCSAQHVKNANAKRYAGQYDRAVESITKRHYVDDLLDSFSSEEEAIMISKQVKDIHASGGFNIRNWISNSQKLMNEMNNNVTTPNVVQLNWSNDVSPEKILGLSWNTISDCFLFQLCLSKVNPDLISKAKIPTKREVLRLLFSLSSQSLYDPLGFLAIISTCAKIFLQEAQRSGVNWDDAIPDDLVLHWHSWLDGLQSVRNLEIPRCITNADVPNTIELHMVSDSSEAAFAAVAYLRLQFDDGTTKISFVAAKTRVAPQKTLSIPRLELQGC